MSETSNVEIFPRRRITNGNRKEKMSFKNLFVVTIKVFLQIFSLCEVLKWCVP